MKDIHNSDTPPPKATDDSGRSSQIFLMEVIVRSGNKLRRAQATDRDIYAITAPLIAEGTVRNAEERIKKVGVVSLAAIFNATDFLESISPAHLLIDLGTN